MKKSFYVLAVLFICFTFIVNATQTFSTSDLTLDIKMKGYFISKDNIVFIFDRDFNENVIKKKLRYDNIVINKVYLMGSFNSWKASDEWKMSRFSDSNIWYIEKSIKEINIPGNSGNPEFKYFGEGTYIKDGEQLSIEGWFQASLDLPVGYKFNDQYENEFNYLVNFPGDNISEIADNHYRTVTLKNDFANDYELSNYRNVATGKIKKDKLYRSYHPFIKSKAVAVEKKRIEKVQELMQKDKICSVINLADTENVFKAKVPDYYKSIYDKGNMILAETSYKDVYYKSNTPEFAKYMSKVLNFIAFHDAPYLIHCRLGTDRTGVVTGFIEAFMGATWKEIREDYSLSNNSWLGEFRDIKLLKYSFENMLQVNLSDDMVLRPAILKLLKEKTDIPDETLNAAYKKLSE